MQWKFFFHPSHKATSSFMQETGLIPHRIVIVGQHTNILLKQAFYLFNSRTASLLTKSYHNTLLLTPNTSLSQSMLLRNCKYSFGKCEGKEMAVQPLSRWGTATFRPHSLLHYWPLHDCTARSALQCPWEAWGQPASPWASPGTQGITILTIDLPGTITLFAIIKITIKMK